MTDKTRLALLFAASAVLLSGALGFQYLGGLAPCPLCLWQRYPHGAVLIVAGGAMAAGADGRWARLALSAAALALLATAGIGVFQAGVEQGWWQGSAGCAGGQPPPPTLEDLEAMLKAPPPPRCDQAAWSLFGLSLAAYNALASTALAVLAILGLRARTK